MKAPATPLISLLFVCMGNICRSPTAHGVMRQLVAEHGLSARVHVDSAGTHSYHLGHAPDPRAQAVARERGIELGDLLLLPFFLSSFGISRLSPQSPQKTQKKNPESEK